MHFIYFDWSAYARKDVIAAFNHLGHTHETLPLSEGAKFHFGFELEYAEEILSFCKDKHFDFAFSMNYFPPVSEACEKLHIPYISWIYDNPYAKAYFINIVNPCNYIFSFDSAIVDELRSRGVSQVHYAPMAANPDRTSTIPMTSADSRFASDISFVGNLYDTEPNFYGEMMDAIKVSGDNYLAGYADALIQMQKNVYGTDLITPAIPPQMIDYVTSDLPREGTNNGYFTTNAEIIADHILYRRLARIERREILELLSSEFSVNLFTTNPNAQVGNCHNLGYVDYMTQMPKVFCQSKINLNISLRSIKKGIPLRAMDIMGAGGFLMTNFQEDFLSYFEPDIDFVYYSSPSDLRDKTAYYLSHDEERQAIANHGLATIKANHTFEIRLNQMLSIVFHS